MYLAEIVKQQQFNSKAIASLLGQKRADGLWVKVARKEVSINGRDLNLKQLVLLKLDNKLNLVNLISTNEAIFECLHECNLRLSQFNLIKSDIAETKESLEYQATKLYQRTTEINRLEELQKGQEKRLEKLQKLAKEKLHAAEEQYIKLTEAWNHLYYKQEQLKNGES